MLFVALEVVVAEADDLAPGHQGSEADRRRVEADPDVGPPLLRFGDVDQDRLGRDRSPEQVRQPGGQPELDVAAGGRVEVEVAEAGVELDGAGADLDRPLVDPALAEGRGQGARRRRHPLRAEEGEERGVVVVGQFLGGERAGQHRLLHRPQQHRHAGAVGVVPVDVVEHLLAGVDQGVERADALVADDDAGRALDAGDPERVDQAGGVDAAVGDVAGAGVAGQVVELVDVERPGEDAAQDAVGCREVASLGVDDAGDAGGIDAPGLRRIAAISGPSIRRRPTVSCGRIGGPSSSIGVREGVVADVVEQGGGGDRARVLVGDPGAAGDRAQVVDGQPRQVEDAERVLEAGVPGAGPDAGDEAELLDPLQAQEGAACRSAPAPARRAGCGRRGRRAPSSPPETRCRGRACGRRDSPAPAGSSGIRGNANAVGASACGALVRCPRRSGSESGPHPRPLSRPRERGDGGPAGRGHRKRCPYDGRRGAADRSTSPQAYVTEVGRRFLRGGAGCG